MECFIVEPVDIEKEAGELRLVGEEAHHALRSLRLRVGEILLATDLKGTCYECKLEEAIGKSEIARCSILQEFPGYGEAQRQVTLIQGMISQPARWEFLLEKATELGVASVQPVSTERTEREHFKAERSERILRAAVKQTRRSRMPSLLLRTGQNVSNGKAKAGELSSLSEALSEAVRENRRLLLLHEAASAEASLWKAASTIGDQPVAIAVGPEGGFSEAEVEQARSEFGAEVVSLGPRRLRAETAALAALAILIDT